MRDKLHDFLRAHPDGAAPEDLLGLVFTQAGADAAFATRFLDTLLAPDPRFVWQEGSRRWSLALHQQQGRSIDETAFVVVDLETAGTTPHPGAIIEIAALRIRGGKTLDRFHTLVQPTMPIPPFVAQLTGIDTEMLQEAPPISSAWPQFRQFVGADVVLAHNAAFDAGFLRVTALSVDGTAFDNPIVCTLKLARQLVPESTKRGLDSLAGIFGIPLADRHRAHGDVRITAEIFFHLSERLLQRGIERLEQLIALQNRASDGASFSCPLPRSKVDPLPAEPGIYRLLGEDGGLLYIGKAKNLRQRVGSYLSNSADHSPKTLTLIRQVHDVRVEPLGSELEAALAEATAIRRERPPYNRLGKHLPRIAFLKLTTHDPFPRLVITRRLGKGSAPCVGPLGSRREAERLLRIMTRLFRLRTCIGRLHPDPQFVPCMQAQVDACTAPCAARVDVAAYAQQVQNFLAAIATQPEVMQQELLQRRDRANDAKQFELAANLTSDVAFMQRIGRRQHHFGWITAQQSFLVLHPLRGRGVIATYAVIGGRLALQRRIVDAAEIDSFAAALADCFTRPRAALPEDVDGAVILTAWLRDRGERAGAVLPLTAPLENGWDAAQVDEWRGAVRALLELDGRVRDLPFG